MTAEDIVRQYEELANHILQNKFDCLKNMILLYGWFCKTNDKEILQLIKMFSDYYYEIERLLIICRLYIKYIEDNDVVDIDIQIDKLDELSDKVINHIYSYTSRKEYLSYIVSTTHCNTKNILIDTYDECYSVNDFLNDINIIKKIS